ncbi:MAG: glycosyltransferase family 4 protein [Chloroflexi bacterium]|nr:MAG: glycosyltransferase family 4 protein [Chloroflexota bacterium]TMF92195.1 MAG: glycosyltransferase family 4 protein [Chloroflexota bacterium]TMG46745.1 MAG: glycosyltransferase family 4 protein [Chloroflexota bacterium]
MGHSIHVDVRRIALIVSPWFPVPPTGYGGIELMAYNLAHELSDRRHHVTVIGRQGSRGPFESLALAPESWSKQLGTRDELARQNLFLYRAYETVRRRAFDVVHDHSGLSGILVGAQARLQAPVVATLHGALSEAEGDFLSTVDRQVHLVAISRAQQAMVAGVEWSGVVHNAIDPAEYSPITNPEEKENYLVELARINPDKGQDVAIEVAKRLKLPLVLAGKVDADAIPYFEEKIKPNLNGQVTWRENVQGKEKAQLLARARALLFPIQWEEPFGLAMVEAMVSGTPVIAFDHGAAPELIEQGVTGFLVHDVDGMVAAYEHLKEIDLKRCAEVAARRFGPAQMADGYMNVYERAIDEAMYSAPPIS